ncbi:uncharacterized protein J4E88_007961 [Alternaria novae-zelandiae]|uniref:uncharacterized protein n=1 Tax=Alternaria novae-zelandiae TaxID=430562 RepID=UPI0020C3C480|nr:uncharacterized protein J4E88_007961 [Alternaria novae-zelandiae]KAI4675057.1 hypothetical protein J4E88_007961 [Alternaria novae-zelandiae]
MALAARPVRAALIGLSSSGNSSWASAAHLPALLTDTGRSKITITALANSSVQAAKVAIQKYGLPDHTKAYGSPEDLAADPDIDLVICNTRVDKHYETILPSIKAGKDVYVEWPIASNKKQIDEIVEAARKSGSRVAVGLQRRWTPPAAKLRQILNSGNGKLGKVLSSDVRAFGGTNDRETMPTGLKYFSQKVIGGNAIVIGVGHGRLDAQSVYSKSQIQRPNVRIQDPQTKQTVEEVTTDVPDFLAVHGTIAQSPITAPNATLSFLFRRGQPFPGTPALTWTINCEYGEILITSATRMTFQMSEGDEPVVIQVHHFDTHKVENVVWDWSDMQKEVPVIGRDVMTSLFAFAEGKAEGEGWVGLEDAATYARMIDGFLEE